MPGNLCHYMIMLPKSRFWKEPFYSSINLTYEDKGSHRIYPLSCKVIDVKSRGKKIVIDFDRSIKMVSSCGMDGRWSWEQSKYTCLIFVFDTFSVYYEDITNKGLFSICLFPSLEYNHIFKDVGPDLMTEEVTYEIYKMIITGPRIGKLKIMEFMMEQKYMSGIGNYLRSEILYKSRINPHRPLCSLSEQDIYNLFYFSKTTIWEAYQSNGLTIQDYLDVSGKNGVYNCLCYGRPIDNNGLQIITEKDKNKRTIHWCPQYQY
uniref:Formamidopyrimidine-DNA glycosylase H2TH DNA-binding domain-containing protein n=1 Tax=viral metagenome TaxID=1070528 RepID=A0A6C0BCH9_9ZZZZ